MKRTPGEADDFLLNKLEKVSLVDTKKSEWWTLRKVTVNATNKTTTQEIDKYETDNKSYTPYCSNKSRYSEYLEESSSFKSSVDAYSFSKTGKRVSDASVSKFGNKRVSLESEHKNESKGSSNINKAHCGKHSLNIDDIIFQKYYFVCKFTNIFQLPRYQEKTLHSLPKSIPPAWKMNCMSKVT